MISTITMLLSKVQVAGTHDQIIPLPTVLPCHVMQPLNGHVHYEKVCGWFKSLLDMSIKTPPATEATVLSAW